MNPAALANPENLFAIFVAVVSFATMMTIITPMFTRSSLESRLKSVSTRREELRRKSREALAANAQGQALRHIDEGMYKRVVDRLQLSRLLEDPKVVEKLAQAGFRGPRPVSTFYFFRFVLPFAFAASAAFYLFLINGFGMATLNKLACTVGAMTLGYYAPNVYISNIASKRRESIVGAFPDTLDLLLICVESGMSIEAAIQKVSQEIGGASIELAEELTLLTAELSYLPERRQAYEGLAKTHQSPRHQVSLPGDDPSRKVRHAAGCSFAHHGQGKSRTADVRSREKGRTTTRSADRADDRVLPAGFVHRDPGTRNHQGRRYGQEERSRRNHRRVAKTVGLDIANNLLSRAHRFPGSARTRNPSSRPQIGHVDGDHLRRKVLTDQLLCLIQSPLQPDH